MSPDITYTLFKEIIYNKFEIDNQIQKKPGSIKNEMIVIKFSRFWFPR